MKNKTEKAAKTLNVIGLDAKKCQQLADGLNDLLTNYQIFYMNVRGYHWNIKGEKFFELHVKFEELYNDAAIKIDEIAERILTLSHTPIHSYSEYIKNSKIKEKTNVSDGKAALIEILESFKIIITKERELLDLSDEANDEGTNSIMSDYVSQQEKLVWMYSAYLNR
ncbi:MAG: DNA starvation/stationary phase protection protein [Sphingobacteriales bacterium JAD_PAG50586_3]|nr:MAG: DNA starvation/stationary phase protection protein [Sphingobacteriales bacterium JAD_PAG50586_3]